MNMNNLNFHQVILLCILVAFITSIATGITVVSLMQQGTGPVTQTINRVVERTVERVVEVDPTEKKTTVQKTPEKEIVTVVVNSEELSIEAVEKNAKSIVRIYTDEGTTNGEVRNFRGLGIVVDEEGTIITDATVIDPYQQTRFRYFAEKDGIFFRVDVVEDVSQTLAKVVPAQESDLPDFTPAVFGDSKTLQLAQSVISISGQKSDVVSSGIIAELQKDDSGENLLSIVSSINEAQIVPGAILVNLQGNIIGMYAAWHASQKDTFKPAQQIKALISNN